MSYLVADLCKLRRPLCIWLSLAMAGLSILLGTLSQEPAGWQLKRARDGLSQFQANPPPPEYFGLQPGPEYEKALRTESSDLQRFLTQTEEDAALVGATQNPLGALGLAVGLTCSMLGAVVILLGAGGHVAGEWSGVTIKELFLADGRRGRLVLAKTFTLFVFGLWLVLCSWLSLAIWGLVSKHVFPIAQPATTSATLDWMVPQLWRGPLVLLLFAASAVALGIVIRHPVGTVLGGVVTIFIFNYMTRYDSVARFSPAAWVASLMGFQRKLLLIDHVWSESTLGLSWRVSAGGLVVTIVVLLAAAVVSVRKRDALP